MDGSKLSADAGRSPDIKGPDFSRHLANLALLRPIMELEADKGRKVRDGSELLANVDTHFVSLSLIHYLMSETYFHRGATGEDCVAAATRAVAACDPSLSSQDALRAGEVVFDALGNHDQPFSRAYFDPAEGRSRTREFRLFREVQVDVDRFLWRITPEALVVYLAMLNVPPDIAERIERLAIQELIKEGKLTEASELADRARAESQLAYEEIAYAVNVAERGRFVEWVGEIVPRMKESRQRLNERIEADGAILAAVSARHPVEDDRDLARLRRIEDVMEECRQVHDSLHKLLNAANRDYLKAQEQRFAVYASGLYVEPEQDVLRPMMISPLTGLVGIAADVTALLSPLAIRTIPELSRFFEAAVESHSLPLDDDAAEIEVEEDIQPPRPRFDDELRNEAAGFLLAQVRDSGSATISGLLDCARRAGLDVDARTCLALAALGTHAEPPDDIASERTGTEFDADEAVGGNVRFYTKEGSDGDG